MEFQVLAVISGMAFEAGMVQGSGIRAIYGLDPTKLEDDIVQAITAGAMGLLSFGTAAGLSPALSSGSIVIGRTIRSQDYAIQADDNWAARLRTALPDAVYEDVAGVDQPLRSIAEKHALAVQAAIADMESHRVARLAQQYNRPFAVLRVVLDGANRALPPAALAAAARDGSVDYPGLIRSLLTKPGQLPQLLALAGDQRKAKQELLRCSQLLKGSLFAMDVG